MDLQNIQEQLNTEFAKVDVRIIFWFDDKGDYAEEVSEIQLGTAKLHILDGENWLYSKWLLNESDPEGKYLVYAPFAKPSDSENPLADMYYYSTLYYTDLVSQMSQEIGIDIKYKEHYVGVPEQGAGRLIPEEMGKPGSLYTVLKSKTGMIGCYHLETQMMPGNGKLTCTDIGSAKESQEATNTTNPHCNLIGSTE